MNYGIAAYKKTKQKPIAYSLKFLEVYRKSYMSIGMRKEARSMLVLSLPIRLFLYKRKSIYSKLCTVF